MTNGYHPPKEPQDKKTPKDPAKTTRKPDQL